MPYKAKSLSWSSELGIWYLIKSKHVTIHGTTPRNAEVWTIDLDVGKYSLWPFIGRHKIGVTFWVGENVKLRWEQWFSKKAEKAWEARWNY